MRLPDFLALILSFTLPLVSGQGDGQPHKKLTPGPRYERLDKGDAVLLMVDLQEGLINMVKDWDTALYKSNIFAYSAVAEVFDLPVIITRGAPAGPNGVVPNEILAMHPNATVVDSQGEVNYWDNEEFREALRATGKSQVIIAGITTDVSFLALSLREEGYGVWAISAFRRDIANQRMADAGVQITRVVSIVMELIRSWADTPGAREVLPWMDVHNPHYGFIARAHGHAVLDGVILPGESEIL